MKICFFLFVIILFQCFVPVFAQERNSKEIANLVGGNIIEMESMQIASLALMQQIDNIAYINQSGSNLNVKLQQTGKKNEANLWQEGGFINQEVFQVGNENVINSYIKNIGLYDKTADLLQEGNNNRIELALFGDGIPTAAQSIKITQQGDGFEAKALMESFNSPIEIIQKAGAGGGNMKIDISISDFSFPMK